MNEKSHGNDADVCHERAAVLEFAEHLPVVLSQEQIEFADKFAFVDVPVKHVHQDIRKKARAFLREEILNQWLVITQYAIDKVVVIEEVVVHLHF